MDIPQFTYGLAAELTPVLPLVTAGRHLGWGLTLMALALFFLKPLPAWLRMPVALALFAACLVPAAWSPSYALGLAYQTPSLVTQGIAITYLIQAWQSRETAYFSDHIASEARWPAGMLVMTSLAGWALLLDTFALLPVQLYTMGYGTAIPLFGLVLAVLLWGMARSAPDPQRRRSLGTLALILLLAMGIFVFTRLPSGNAWDAMLDPWLWLIAQLALLKRALQFLFARFVVGNRDYRVIS